MSLPKLIQYTGPARANDGRLPVTESAAGQVGLSTKGSRGPWVASGVTGQGRLFKGFTQATHTLTPAQVIGANIGVAALLGNYVWTLPTAAEIVSYLGSDLVSPPAAIADPVPATTNTGASFLGVSFPFTVSFTDGINTIQFGASTGVSYHFGGNPAVAGVATFPPFNSYPGVQKFRVVVTNATPGSEAVSVYRN